MVTKEELKKMLVGKRVLYTMTLSSQVPPIEAEVLEISPSGNYIKLQRLDGPCTWEVVSTIYIADVLDEGGLSDMRARWIPVTDTAYYYIDEAGEVQTAGWTDSSADRKRFSYGNVFKNYQQAEALRNKIKRALFTFHRIEATPEAAAPAPETAKNNSNP
jgi:hypothetical protein